MRCAFDRTLKEASVRSNEKDTAAIRRGSVQARDNTLLSPLLRHLLGWIGKSGVRDSYIYIYKVVRVFMLDKTLLDCHSFPVPVLST